MKRANGTGSIAKLSGNRRRPYLVRISARNQLGAVVQRVLGYYPTVRNAQIALDSYNQLVAEGRAPCSDGLGATVQQVYEAWAARRYKKLNPASIASHKAAWNMRVSRYAGRKMREVTLDEWQAILDEGEAAGLSQSAINNDALLIKALCAYSAERDILGKNYAEYLELPTVDAKKRKGAFDDRQIQALKRMAADGFPWADTALILCYTGFRVSELLSLTPAAYHPEDGGYLQGGGKTEAGRNRIVPVHPQIASYLAARVAQGQGTILHRDGQPLTAKWYREQPFRRIARELGTPEATPHWCRHTFATRLYMAKVDALTIKWLMGHSTKRDITAHYTHSTIVALREGILCLK